MGSCCTSKTYKIVVYDTETNGGGNPHRIIELAAYAIESGEKFDTLISCDCEVCTGHFSKFVNLCSWHSVCTGKQSQICHLLKLDQQLNSTFVSCRLIPMPLESMDLVIKTSTGQASRTLGRYDKFTI